MATRNIYEDYEIPEEDQQIMLGMLGMDHTQEGVVLPDRVRRKYIEFRIPADRVSQGMTHFHLWCVVCAAGPITVPKKEPDSVLKLWKEKKLNIGDKVFCTLANKKNLKAILIGIGGDNRPLLAMDNGEERKFDPEKVYMTKV